uniref:Activin_recp domain-containing protein n=1 Tax=Parascaris univalens TaxID=6257 RepID=A0A915BQH6_PARUN
MAIFVVVKKCFIVDRFFALYNKCQLKMVSTRYLLLVLLVSLTIRCRALKCYSGQKFIRGQKIDETTECSSRFDFCYYFTAEATLINKIKRAGCSTVRCQLARNTCRETTISNIPVKLCCCDTDLCNKG